MPHVPAALADGAPGRAWIATRIAFASTALIAATLLVSMCLQRPGWVIVALIWGVAILSVVRPLTGLLVLAGLGPLVPITSILLGADVYGLHFPEAMALAFLAGAAARRSLVTIPFAVPLRVVLPAVLLIGAVLASAIVQSAALAAEQPHLAPGGVFPTGLVTHYLVLQNTVTVAVQFAEGLLLLLLAADICARDRAARDRVLTMMVAAASGVAVLNLVRLITAAMRREHVWASLLEYVTNARVNVQYSDWNAAGSYLALTLFIASALVTRRVYSALPLVVIAAAVWATGSRTAMAAILVIAAAKAAWSMRRLNRRQNAVVVVTLIVLVGVAAIGWMWYPSQRNDPAAFSITTRLDLWKAAIRMTATAPVFGIGVGRFYVLSADYAAPVLQIIWRPHENAHNYFIQVLAELGVPGLILFIAVIVSALGQLRGIEATRLTSGLQLGLVAYLLTCLTGHPLLVPDAAYPFWLALGLAAAGSSTTYPGFARRWTVIATVCVLLVFVATLPVRTRDAVRQANMAATTVGLSGWERGPDGRFRWAAARSTFFVSSAGRAVRIPLRLGPDAPARVEVRVLFNQREADRIQLDAGEPWRLVRLIGLQRDTAAFYRIDLEVRADGADTSLATARRVLMVGEPAIVWRQ